MTPSKDFEAINQRDNAREQSGYTSRIKARGLEKPTMVLEYTGKIRDGDTTYTVTTKNYTWKKGFLIPAGPYAKQDNEAMIFVTNDKTGKTNAITYSHSGPVYWKNVAPGKGGEFEATMPTSWHTTILKPGSYEKVSWAGKKMGIGHATLWYTKGAQKLADVTQRILKHASQEMPEAIAGVPWDPRPIRYNHGKQSVGSIAEDVKTAFTRPSELWDKVEKIGKRQGRK